jgi:hypothetical protein
MIHFKLNGKKVSIKSSWDELTFTEYCEILKNKLDTIGLISLFSGIDCEILKKATIIGLDEVLISLSFLNTPPVVPGYVDKVGKYVLPITGGKFNIQFEALGQFEDMRSIIKKLPSDTPYALTESFPAMVSIYLQKVRDGEYNYQKAQEMIPEIRLMPALEVISLGSFFFVKLLSLSTGTKANSLPTNQSPKKLKRGTKSSRKPLAVTARSRKRR